ncbi:MAG: DUF4325 domain-containing protein [Clostridiales bacterium]|nr:DUF4325 domain-containing protein [Clostridiales bacterium]
MSKISKWKNKIIFEGDIDSYLINESLHKISSILNSGYAEIILDFEKCKSIFALGSLRLISFIKPIESISFKLNFGKNKIIKNLFINSNWARIIDNEIKESSYRGCLLTPTQHYKDSNEQSQIVNSILNSILFAFDNIDRNNFSGIEWTLYEIMDNVLNHSESTCGGFVQFQIFRGKKPKIEFVVSDSGLGIPQTLKSKFPDYNNPQLVIDSMKEGVTNGNGMGNGLYGSSKMADLSGGFFSIQSDDVLVTRSLRSGVYARKIESLLSGTTVFSSIPLGEDNILPKALIFKGKRHSLTDYIETSIEMQSEDSKYVYTFDNTQDQIGSRQYGRYLRNYFKNILSASEIELIVFDFHLVNIISSSFADELIGKLYIEFGQELFNRHFKLEGMNEQIELVFTSVFSQRD